MSAPATGSEVADQVLWRLWRNNLRPSRELAIGDDVWLRYGSGRNAVIAWHARVSELVSRTYRDVEEAADIVERELGLVAASFLRNDYTAGKHGPGHLLALVAEPLTHIEAAWPAALGNMPQSGVLALDGIADSQLRAWGLLQTLYGVEARDDEAVADDNVSGVGAGRVLDSALRRRIEDYAQDALMRRYEKRGYEVQDTRTTRPYDAVARRGRRALYLEAKGTQSERVNVEVTAGEANHVRAHPGQCVLGVVTGIVVDTDGSVGGGVLHVFEPWEIDEGSLTPVAYRHIPRSLPGCAQPEESL